MRGWEAERPAGAVRLEHCSHLFRLERSSQAAPWGGHGPVLPSRAAQGRAVPSRRSICTKRSVVMSMMLLTSIREGEGRRGRGREPAAVGDAGTAAAARQTGVGRARAGQGAHVASSCGGSERGAPELRSKAGGGRRRRFATRRSTNSPSARSSCAASTGAPPPPPPLPPSASSAKSVIAPPASRSPYRTRRPSKTVSLCTLPPATSARQRASRSSDASVPSRSVSLSTRVSGVPPREAAAESSTQCSAARRSRARRRGTPPMVESLRCCAIARGAMEAEDDSAGTKAPARARPGGDIARQGGAGASHRRSPMWQGLVRAKKIVAELGRVSVCQGAGIAWRARSARGGHATAASCTKPLGCALHAPGLGLRRGSPRIRALSRTVGGNLGGGGLGRLSPETGVCVSTPAWLRSAPPGYSRQ
jgi:hypothetical protein